ncbi:MFS transporter [Streptomyces roseoverticillatus]|uniref:MFS transporter n=1 Tax=Streptomyces roseoverticillatus TaxID=66429 RepID=UPI001F2015F0|nr:MFS transporter [Streptomyces roseoverticillatus]MCF3103922.1 MFS transporter [Streptomyces roseoverticillatus]
MRAAEPSSPKPRPAIRGAGRSRTGRPSSARATTAILVIACTAQFMVILDVSVLNVALPAMRAELRLGPAGQQWIVNAYTLAFAGLLLLGGRAADLVGTRRAFLAGVTAFTLASLAGGFATEGSLLIAARAVQGAGGAVLAPATLTLIMRTFTEPAARTRAMGAWSAVMAAGGAVGGVVGGVLTEYAGWRWVLFVNVPIGAGLLAAAVICVPAAEAAGVGAGAGAAGGLRRLDLPGAVSVTLGLTALVHGTVASGTHAWGAWMVWGSLAAGALLLAVFVAVERRAAHPLVPLATLRRRTVATANLLVLCMGAAAFSMWFMLSLYFQQVLGESALVAGLCFLPGSAAIVAGAQIATRLIARTGPRPIILTGMTISTVGFLWMSRIGAHADGDYVTDVLGPFVLATLGAGLSLMPVTAAATSGTAPHEAGLASGLVNTSRQMGGALGLAMLGTVAAHAGGGAAGYGRALLVGAACTAAAGAGALALPRLRDLNRELDRRELDRRDPDQRDLNQRDLKRRELNQRENDRFPRKG